MFFLYINSEQPPGAQSLWLPGDPDLVHTESQRMIKNVHGHSVSSYLFLIIHHPAALLLPLNNEQSLQAGLQALLESYYHTDIHLISLMQQDPPEMWGPEIWRPNKRVCLHEQRSTGYRGKVTSLGLCSSQGKGNCCQDKS